MITDRDIAVRAIADGRARGNTSVRDVMSEGVDYCFEDDDAEAAAQIMVKHQIRRLPVLNRDKRLVGVGALADFDQSEARAAQGYCGPAPPKGHGTHHYHFRLAALDVEELSRAPKMSVEDVWEVAEKHMLAEADLVGTYKR